MFEANRLCTIFDEKTIDFCLISTSIVIFIRVYFYPPLKKLDVRMVGGSVSFFSGFLLRRIPQAGFKFYGTMQVGQSANAKPTKEKGVEKW